MKYRKAFLNASELKKNAPAWTIVSNSCKNKYSFLSTLIHVCIALTMFLSRQQ
jgi:hypothetical protein